MVNCAEQIGIFLRKNGLTLSTAESCTGGLVSSFLTDVSGSSDYIKINFVTYANEAKMSFVNVQKDTLDKYGAVSEQTAKEMAQGLLKYSDVGISTTGIAGPTGGTKEKPVGLMFTAIATKNFCCVKKVLLSSDIDRIKMKEEFSKSALEFAYEKLKEWKRN